jgi:soluble lytic murein transglycosylase-like protein
MTRMSVLAFLAFGSIASIRAAAAADVPRCAEDARDISGVHAAVEAEAKAQGVDVNLALAIVDQESRFGAKTQADKETDKGARGPMQLMPATAQRFDVKDVCDPTQNIRGGVAYLKELSVRFGGNIIFIASAYNAGEGRVYAAKGVPPLAETVRYAASVANIYYRYDNALRGGSLSLRTVGDRLERHAADAAATDVPSPAPSPNGAQKWIGGSVLYVEGDD